MLQRVVRWLRALRERSEDAHVTLRRLHLMKISLRNRELVIALCRVSSYFYEMAKQCDRFVVLFLIHLQAAQLKRSLWIILAQAHCSLQVLLSLQVVTFFSADEPKIEQRWKVVGVRAE